MERRAVRSFADLLDRFEDVEPDGRGYRVPCPAHNDSHPSLVLTLKDDGKLLIHCRAGCPRAAVLAALDLTDADLFDLAPGGDVRTASAAPPAPVAGPTVAALRRYVESCADRLQEGGPNGPAAQYLAERFGMDLELAEHLRLGLDPGGDTESLPWRSRTYWRVPRLVVPFADAMGVVRGLQGRDLTGDSPVRWCGLSNPQDGSVWSKVALFALDTDLPVIMICEGPSDALTAVAAGYDAVAIRGAALGDAVSELAGVLAGRRVILCGDNDTAGRTFNTDVDAALRASGIRPLVLVLPPGVGDLNEWRCGDRGGFRLALDHAVDTAQPYDEQETGRVPDQGDRATIQMTDLGNAERLRAQLELVRYSPATGHYIWGPNGWELDTSDRVRTAAHDVTRGMVTDAEALLAKDAESTEGKRLKAWGLRSQSTRHLDAMIRELGALRGVAVDVEQMDSQPDLLACANGVVNLRTGELSDHDPGLLLTRRLAVDYDPDAECPRWERFLAEVFPGQPELPAYLARLLGYGITGHTSEQCFAVLWGNGSNGKSVLTDTLAHVFRAFTVTTPFSTFEERKGGGIPNDLAALKGARLVMASEGEQGQAMAESVIKRVTGSDLIAARFMRREFFEFYPTFLLLLATNHRPAFRGQDEGLWRRVKLLPFERYFTPEERDHYLTDKLRAEAPGIVAWAVRGARTWYAHGLQEPKAVVAATSDFRASADKLDGFYPGRLVPQRGTDTTASEVYRAYTAWADSEGLSHHEVWSRTAFYRALEERGVHRTRRAQGMVLLNVSLVTTAHGAALPTYSDARRDRVGAMFSEGRNGT